MSKRTAGHTGNKKRKAALPPYPETKTGDAAATTPPTKSNPSREAKVTNRLKGSLKPRVVTPVDGDSSSVADTVVLSEYLAECDQTIWEPRMTRDHYSEVMPGNTGVDYRFVWIDGRPSVALEDVHRAVVEGIGECPRKHRNLEFSDTLEDYVPLSEAIRLIPCAGNLFYDLFELCELRTELEERGLEPTPWRQRGHCGSI